jgi:hypothetical protein
MGSLVDVGLGAWTFLVKSAKRRLEVSLRVTPREGSRGLAVVPFESHETFPDSFWMGEVVGREGFPLHDSEVDLDLVEPTGVHGQVHADRLGMPCPKPLGKRLGLMHGTVVRECPDFCG